MVGVAVAVAVGVAVGFAVGVGVAAAQLKGEEIGAAGSGQVGSTTSEGPVEAVQKESAARIAETRLTCRRTAKKSQVIAQKRLSNGLRPAVAIFLHQRA